MQLFNKPTWLKPEINDPKYYLHLIIVATVALAILQLFSGGDMLTLRNVLLSVPLLLVGDVIAHTVVRMD